VIAYLIDHGGAVLDRGIILWSWSYIEPRRVDPLINELKLVINNHLASQVLHQLCHGNHNHNNNNTVNKGINSGHRDMAIPVVNHIEFIIHMRRHWQ
jgi:hypothetical protein